MNEVSQIDKGELVSKSRVDNLIDRRRNESDARDIIKEVERLATFEGEHRYRWIWELLQNARDEANDGVQIVCIKEADKFIFQHNGKPFLSDNLIALTLRSSTKPLDGAHGNAGKFGTGFVTTHLLNKQVRIEGVHENEEGRRRFVHELDRMPVDLGKMMENLASSIQNIREIDEQPSAEITNEWNSFEYDLNLSGLEIANGGIKQLERNLAFALLINEDKIKSVSIFEDGNSRTLRIDKIQNVIDDISFLNIINDNEPYNTTGLLFKEYHNLIIAVPAKCDDNQYQLLPIGASAHLFKELPLIGSEDFAIPNIIQHKDFQPTEPRDGVRTKRLNEDPSEEDLVAHKNRQAFEDYVLAFPDFLTKLIDGKVKNLHLMAESGLPLNPESIYSKKWLQENLQSKLREEILNHKVVYTANGDTILISDSYFPYCSDEYLEAFHKLLKTIFPEKTPDDESFKDWQRIISQDSDSWPTGILIDIKTLVEKINGDILIKQFHTQSKINSWLQELVNYLEITQNERLGLEHAIYPNQEGNLIKQNEVFREVNIHDQFKTISKNLGRDLTKELLPIDFKAKSVNDFDVKNFLDSINTIIGNLKLDMASDAQKQAIIDLCCTFENVKAPRREEWFNLLSRLLPNKVKGKVFVDLEENYNWESPEKWALKMVSDLIQNSQNIGNFTEKYFCDEKSALDWLNDFLVFVFRNEETRSVLDYNIILTQDGNFKKYSDNLFREDKPSEFIPLLKKLYMTFVGKADPLSFLIHSGITSSNLRSTDVSILTRPLDDIFKDRSVEDKVKEGLEYHDLFLNLKDLTEDEYWAKLFPLFSEKQPILFIKAFGAGSSVSRLLKIKKPIEELEKLANLSLSADHLKQLDDAVKVIGNPNSLLEKARQLAENAEEVRWRQNVGGAAERAFIEALGEADPNFFQPENPDNGRDFIIRIGTKHYSVEIKSAIENKESVKMSLRQGEEATKEPDNYALCVISRPIGTLTNKEQFIKNAKFVTNIGIQIGDKVRDWREGLASIEKNDNISVELDNKSGHVNIRKAIWESGINFDKFVKELKIFFQIPN